MTIGNPIFGGSRRAAAPRLAHPSLAAGMLALATFSFCSIPAEAAAVAAQPTSGLVSAPQPIAPSLPGNSVAPLSALPSAGGAPTPAGNAVAPTTALASAGGAPNSPGFSAGTPPILSGALASAGASNAIEPGSLLTNAAPSPAPSSNGPALAVEAPTQTAAAWIPAYMSLDHSGGGIGDSSSAGEPLRLHPFH